MRLAFDMPMAEAQTFWKSKVPMSREDWDELVEAQRARSFMVSGLTRHDQISAVQQAIADAIDAGTTFEDFKAAIPDIIAQQNWSGIRLQIIFRTNVQTAYNAGRYVQMQQVKESRPYWMYSAINDSRTRPAHRAMDGKIFPADHEFWNTWMPPNGYRCRCSVVTLSDREIERDNLKVEHEDPTGKLFEPTDFRTKSKMPARMLMPDPGFNQNVGKDWLTGLSPEKIKKSATQPATKFSESGSLAFLKALGSDGKTTVARPLPGGFVLAVGPEMVSGVKAPWADLAQTILNPDEAWAGPAKHEEKTYQGLTLVRTLENKTTTFRLIGPRLWDWTQVSSLSPQPSLQVSGLSPQPSKVRIQ